MAKLFVGKELEQRCRELGIDTQGPPGTLQEPQASDYELQRRVIEAERSIRENRLWMVAVGSMIVSVLSAATALVALYMLK
jgi:hypothetical protein